MANRQWTPAAFTSLPPRLLHLPSAAAHACCLLPCLPVWQRQTRAAGAGTGRAAPTALTPAWRAARRHRTAYTAAAHLRDSRY